MALGFLLLNVCVVLVAARLRYGEAALAHAAPVALAPGAWWWIAGGVALLAAAAALAGRAALRRPGARAALAELMILPAFFAYEWALMPAFVEDRTLADWLLLGALVAAVAAAFYLDRRRGRRWGFGAKHFLGAVRWLAAPTAVMVAAPVAFAAAAGAETRLHHAGPALATYPLYALAQLAVFQGFLVVRLRRVSASRAEIVAAAAGVFALVHWPNGVVMLACGFGAAVWTFVYLHRPNLCALALSMGLAAVAFAYALPEDLTEHMRTGPIYVRRRVELSQGRIRGQAE
jgi:hypothetical protein